MEAGELKGGGRNEGLETMKERHENYMWVMDQKEEEGARKLSTICVGVIAAREVEGLGRWGREGGKVGGEVIDGFISGWGGVGGMEGVLERIDASLDISSEDEVVIVEKVKKYFKDLIK